MTILLLIVIYLTFISLGLPDSLLGSAWPAIHKELEISYSSAGIITMIVSGSSIISSLISDKVIRKFGIFVVTLTSVVMTASALMGFSYSNAFWMLIALSVVLGLGAGSIDTALNNFVAIHYKATHMNWLHCFWGLGATLGPIIISDYLLQPEGWHSGYRIIAMIQAGLAFIVFISLPLWKKVRLKSDTQIEKNEVSLDNKSILKVPKVKTTLLAMFFYCAAEMTVGIWGSTYLVTVRDFSLDMGARAIAFYFGGITVGRMIAGFISMKMDNKSMVRLGQGVSLVGIVLVLISLGESLSILGLLLVGLGFAPIFPAMIHETPQRFGTENSQKIVGYQMVSSSIGITFMPMLLGQASRFLGIKIFPSVLIGFIIMMIISSESTFKSVRH